MNRIKNFNEIIVRGDMLLCEMVEKTHSGLYLPEEVTAKTWDYLKVVVVGARVEDVKVGDIILAADAGVVTYEVDGKKYGIISRNFCSIIVKPDNFTL